MLDFNGFEEVPCASLALRLRWDVLAIKTMPASKQNHTRRPAHDWPGNCILCLTGCSCGGNASRVNRKCTSGSFMAMFWFWRLKRGRESEVQSVERKGGYL